MATIKPNEMKNKNLIGISGRINSGKDTVGGIIQLLIGNSLGVYKTKEDFIKGELHIREKSSGYQIKKYAYKLKQIVSLLIGCTMKQLEDREFKDTPLGPEWDVFYYTNAMGDTFITLNEQVARMEHSRGYGKRQMTPRMLFQLLGTDAGRNVIHPNLWVNALFADYTSRGGEEHGGHVTDELDFDVYSGACKICATKFYTKNKYTRYCKKHWEELCAEYPKWIITDVRFPNELAAIEDRGGITIRVNRFDGLTAGQIDGKEHESETALDNGNFDYVVDNNGSLQDLIDKVEHILKLEEII